MMVGVREDGTVVAAAHGEGGGAPTEEFLGAIPHEFARRHLVLSGGVETSGGHLIEVVRCAASMSWAVAHNVGVRLGRGVRMELRDGEWLAREIDAAYAAWGERGAGRGGPVETAADGVNGAQGGGLQGREAGLSRDIEAALASADRDLLATSGKGPVVRFVDGVLFEALGRRASDVHIQPLTDRTLVRYRIDGVLHTAHVLPPAATQAVVGRIKVMGRMDIAERRVPQDGRATVTIGREATLVATSKTEDTPTGESRSIDLRLSTLPTSYGERVVMRLLDTRQGRALSDFAGLGMPQEIRSRFLACASRSSGIILVTGPTGSGKTTTLYTTLNRIARGEGTGELPAGHDRLSASLGRRSSAGEASGGLNVMTIEDPIEYELATAGVAISQAQVNTKKGVTFARGLRHILRQDPDVVMVGEIRDEETARIAIQASLTGHLVLSTLHTNDAAGAVTRLVDLGVEPYLVGASLACVLAQRLVRRVHEPCTGAGCDACFGTGFRGRIGMFELLVVDERVRALVIGSSTATAIRDAARSRGMRTLREAGLELVAQGVTTRVEVERVAHMLEEDIEPIVEVTSGVKAEAVA